MALYKGNKKKTKSLKSKKDQLDFETRLDLAETNLLLKYHYADLIEAYILLEEWWKKNKSKNQQMKEKQISKRLPLAFAAVHHQNIAKLYKWAIYD